MQQKTENLERPLQGIARVALNIISLVGILSMPVSFLLLSGLVVFAPVIAFIIWFLLQIINKTLKRTWKLSIVLFIGTSLLNAIMLWAITN